MFGSLSMSSSRSIAFVSASTWIWSVSTSERSGTKSKRRSRSSSWSFSEMPRTGPFWSTSVRDEVQTSLALFLLELQRDATHGSFLDALHQVRHEACNLVAHPLGWGFRDLIHHPFVGLE